MDFMASLKVTKKRWLPILSGALCLLQSAMLFANSFDPYNLAFYYGSNPPLNQLKFYKNIVIEPSSGADPHKLESKDRTVYAYASVGEAIDLHQYAQPIEEKWVMTHNASWQSLVLDQSNPEWQKFFLEQVITPLWEKGYRGFFLDTLDSYRIASEDPQKMRLQQQGLITIIQSIKNKYPDAKLILNRGFEIIPEVRASLDAVVAESLFDGWNNKLQKYVPVTKESREQLITALKKVTALGLPVTIIDYLPKHQKNKAKQDAQKILDLGFNAWITDHSLTQLYLFDKKLLKRKICVFYQGRINNADDRLNSEANYINMPLNFLGYVPVLYNLNQPLPELSDEYAGIVVFNNNELLGRSEEIYQWYKKQIERKIPIVFMGGFGFPAYNQQLKLFGLSTPSFTSEATQLTITYQSPMMGYELPPIIRHNQFTPVILNKGKSLLKVKNNFNETFDVAAITPWGGYYLSSNVFLLSSVIGEFEWTIDPFLFLQEALHLPSIPVPDTTTENGVRLMMAHIDGDGFANQPERPSPRFDAELMFTEIIERYKIPTTVSIIQGELAPNGVLPNLSAQLEPIARKIFASPYVEIGTHTFSHPFNWHDAENYKGQGVNPYTLPVKNYKLNFQTEINGSVSYINGNLAPPGKKCEAVLWSGDGDPPLEALKYTYDLGLSNINPGVIANNFYPSITNIASLGLFEGPYFQMYAPIGNDYETVDESDMYLSSLIQIRASLKLTDKPRRLKPIDIYTHFYTVGQEGAIKALHKVYKWALSNPVNNIFVSEYFHKVQDFNRLLISPVDGGWLVNSDGSLREFRIPQNKGYPDLINSRNIIGYSDYNEDRYIHLGPEGESFIALTKQPSKIPYLKTANARVTRFKRENQDINLSMISHTPIKFTLANMNDCSLWYENAIVNPQRTDNFDKYYEFSTGNKHDFFIKCS